MTTHGNLARTTFRGRAGPVYTGVVGAHSAHLDCIVDTTVRPTARTAEGGQMDDSLLISVEDLSTARDRASKSMTDNDGND
ncbi:MAG: hypothetical protein ACRDRL_18020 [Sciscionella sp.]